MMKSEVRVRFWWICSLLLSDIRKEQENIHFKSSFQRAPAILIKREHTNQKMKNLSKLSFYSKDLVEMFEKLFLNGCHLISTASKNKKIQMQDFKTYSLNPNEEQVFPDWEKAKKSSPASSASITLLKFLLKMQWKKLLALFILNFVLQTIVFYRPVALENLLSIGQTSSNETNWYVYILYYVLFELIYTFIEEVNSIERIQFHMKYNNACKTLIFEKILKLSGSSKKYLETGVLNSYYNEDCGIIGHSIYQMYTLFVCPFTIIIGTSRLCNEIGVLGLLAPFIITLTLISQNLRRKQTKLLEKQRSKLSDKKSKLVNEYVSGMKILKYYGWQKIAKEKILGIRNEEKNIHNDIHKHYEIGHTLISGIPNFFLVLVFIYLSLTGQPITLTKFLVLNAIMEILKRPFFSIYYNINDYTKVRISLTKLSNFLNSEEKSEEGDNEEVGIGEIMMQGCKFQWENRRVREEENRRKLLIEEAAQKEKLENDQNQEEKVEKKDELLNLDEEIPTVLQVNELKVEKGELVGVVGKVGSGKSTLISAILKQVNQSEGVCYTRGKIAYCPQIAWLKNDTIRENILFGEEYDEERYNDVLKRTELVTDLESIEKGDETIVGEKGIKLSGGQKQRISIARCLYSDCSIYLFDDCLSALDAYVGKNIFFNVIKELQDQGKTVVLVLNAIEYLKYCEKTIYIESGKTQTLKDLNELKEINAEFFETISHHEEKEDSANEEKKEELDLDEVGNESLNKSVKTTKTQTSEENKTQQKTEEEKKTSEDDISVTKLLFRFITDNFEKQHLLLLACVIVLELSCLIEKWWIGLWTKNEDQDKNFMYMVGTIFIFFGIIVLNYSRSIHMRNTGLIVGNKIQTRYLDVLFKTPMNWFDSKPVGEILDRAIKYQNRIDHEIIWAFNWIIYLVLTFTVCLLMVVSQSIFNFGLILLMFFIFYKINQLVLLPAKKITDFWNEETQKRSSFLQESINGTYLIRTFQKQLQYKGQQISLNDKILAIRMNGHYLRGSFLTILMKFTSNIIIASIAFFIIYALSLRTEPIEKSESIWISLTLNSSIEIGGIISSFFHCRIWLTEICSSLDKIYDWVLNNPSEKSFTDPKPSENWLSEGSLSVQNVSYRYKPELPIVLKNISFDVKQNQKIGIVGRTGSGKSTMTLGMLRILEICENEDNSKGQILMNSTDVSEMGLHYLRHSVAMIPQDPLLFSGTLKSNIDPFDKYSDEEVADSLKKVHIWDDLKEDSKESDPIKKKLYSKIEEEGSNYSLGQRQLICLARALVRNPKVLLMDEATASIDLKTDNLIQKMISEEFKDTTVITIAHRLNTIINYDKILVLEKGEVKEYESPKVLVNDEDSFLGKSIRKVGKEYCEKMIKLANKQ